MSLFDDFFIVGVEAEFITKLFLETSTGLVQDQLGVKECLDIYWTDPETDTGDLKMDIVICEEDNCLLSQRVEVKSAYKPEYLDTFYAEIVSVGSNGYAHYLIDKPEWITYVDMNEKKLYFYDGKEFCHRVKNRQHSAITNKFGTATGIKFGCTDLDFGYRFQADIRQQFHYVRTKCYEQVQERAEAILKATDKNKIPIHRKCEGFPDL